MSLRSFLIGTRLGIGFCVILGGLIIIFTLSVVLAAKNSNAMINGLNTASQKLVLANVMKRTLFESGIAMRNIGMQSDVAETLKDAVGQAFAFNVEGAVKIISSVMDPVGEKYISEINKLDDFQETTSRQIFELAKVTSAQLSFWLFMILFAATVIGTVFAQVVTKSITQPLHDALELTETVARGDYLPRRTMLQGGMRFDCF